MIPFYPNLEIEMTKRGIKKKAIYLTLGITGRTLYNKMYCGVPFTWPEVCIIQEVFFPDLPKEALFDTGQPDRAS